MRERERKMRESHTGGKAKSFGANFIDWWIDSFYRSSLRLIYCSESRKLQKKSMKQQNYIEGNFGTKPQKVVNTANRAGCEISQVSKFRNQPAKFCRLRKFTTLQNLCNAHSSSVFSSNCLLICTCNFEFDSSSSYLN